MIDLAILGLTPTQHAEVSNADPALVQAWLLEMQKIGAAIKSPTGWFLAGIRSGIPPGQAGADDPERARRIRLSENYVRNAGLYEPSVDSILASVFEDNSKRSLAAWADDQALRQRIGDLWEREQPRARRAESESEARAAKYLAQKATKPADDEPELEDEP